MSALGALSIWRHAAVGTAVVGTSALAFTGLIGAERYEEKFDAKQVTVVPAGDNGLALREVVDQDFGDNDRRGYQRIIPNDFGVPTGIEASSPDAPDDVNDSQVPGGTQIRIGDPNTTISGQHRYELAYTLPDARLGSGELALDIIGAGEELSTDRFEIVVAGLELEDPLCNVGRSGDSGGCALERDGDVYRAVISPLDAGDGITIGGTIVGRSEPADVPIPTVPERRDVPSRVPLSLSLLPLGAVTGGVVYAFSRRHGRNEVFAGGAADAAYGDGPLRRPIPGAPLPPPGSEPTPRADATPSTTSVRLVADDDMADLATTEFVPPTGIDPWLGAVVVRETVDNDTVSAWFSGLAAREILSIERAGGKGKKVTLRRGPKVERAEPEDATLIARLFKTDEEIELGSYDKQFASVWTSIRSRQRETVTQSGYWKRPPPAAAGSSGVSAGAIVMVGLVIMFVGGASVLTAALGFVQNPIAALVFGAVVTAVAALAAYATLLPARSATGSAVALRTESFRRFLAASEGRHVEWAWKHGMLREYSAWAVALGAADTWERALEGSSVPPAEYVGGPLLVYAMAGSFSSSHTAPSSSGSGGFSGGGFSGGSVGGGGGGGSSGSW